jgi:hypothetical protein
LSRDRRTEAGSRPEILDDLGEGAEQAAAETPRRRKMASSTCCSPWRASGSAAVAGGAEPVCWIRAADFVRACDLLVERDDIAGPVNLAAPGPLGPCPSVT